MAIYPSLRIYQGVTPTLGARVYLDPQACVIGDVVLGDDVSVWPMVVIRGDVNAIRVGPRTSVQDGSVLHVSHPGPDGPPGGHPLVIGADVTIGHKAVLHGCTVGDRCLVGMGAIVLDGVVIEDQVMVGAGALVPPGKRLRRHTLWIGNPAREARALTAREIEGLTSSAAHYLRVKDRYLGA